MSVGVMKKGESEGKGSKNKKEKKMSHQCPPE
jgi:hypothetical protein